MKKKEFPIDLSMLTEEERDQFRKDPSTLLDGDVDVALYLRYSSSAQSDQSIEGQLRDCRRYCKANGYRIAAVYVDRAATARKDLTKRVQLMRLIADSARGHWSYVVVWKLDRFARNRNDAAMMKMRLKKNNVQLRSATEHITDSPESILLEAVLEGMAEFFSAELSQKVSRGMRETALKCRSVGGQCPLGYKVKDGAILVDPLTAPIVQEAFQLYASGKPVSEICEIFNSKGYRTSKGSPFNKNSFRSMFKNERYIGVYTYKDMRIENGVPAIINKELFDAVQKQIVKTREAPARSRAKIQYLLSGKLFCGHCGARMNGESGVGSNGQLYRYYTCFTRKEGGRCRKKPLPKDYIETLVAQDAMGLMNEALIEEIADLAVAQSEKDIRETSRVPELTARLKELDKSIGNIITAVEKGVASDSMLERLMALEGEKKSVARQLKEEEKLVYRVDRKQVVYWLRSFLIGDIQDEDFRRKLLDLLVNSVTVWDDPDGIRVTAAYNLTSKNPRTYRAEKIPDNAGSSFGLEVPRSTRLQELPAKGKILTSARVFLFPQKLFDSQKRKSCLWSCRYFDASRGFFWAGDSRRCCICFVCLPFLGGVGNSFVGCFQVYLGQHKRKERATRMPETKNLCAKIPLALYTQVNEAKAQTGQTTNEYITSLLAEYFEMKRNGGNTTMTGNSRTMAFQIPEELFQRIKAHLERESARLGRKFTQREFVLGLIEEALTDAEQMNAEENPTDAEQTSAEENPSDIEQPIEADAYEEEELPPEKN